MSAPGNAAVPAHRIPTSRKHATDSRCLAWPKGAVLQARRHGPPVARIRLWQSLSRGGAKVLILGHDPTSTTPVTDPHAFGREKKYGNGCVLACYEISSDEPNVDGRVIGIVACHSQDLLQRDIRHEPVARQ